mgnify:CR=1 FL=1
MRSVSFASSASWRGGMSSKLRAVRCCRFTAGRAPSSGASSRWSKGADADSLDEKCPSVNEGVLSSYRFVVFSLCRAHYVSVHLSLVRHCPSESGWLGSALGSWLESNPAQFRRSKGSPDSAPIHAAHGCSADEYKRRKILKNEPSCSLLILFRCHGGEKAAARKSPRRCPDRSLLWGGTKRCPTRRKATTP